MSIKSILPAILPFSTNPSISVNISSGAIANASAIAEMDMEEKGDMYCIIARVLINPNRRDVCGDRKGLSMIIGYH